MIFLKNDYSVGAHPAVLQALVDSNLKYFDSYGNDVKSLEVAAQVRERIGQPEADVHFIVGGTLTNKTCLAAFARPYEAIISSTDGHIAVHETGAIEATGHRLLEVCTDDGKIRPEQIKEIVACHNMDQMVLPKVVYISNTTELGSVYTREELMALRKVCDECGLYLYIDGARLAMALGVAGGSAESGSEENVTDEQGACTKDHMSMAEIAGIADAFYVGGAKCGGMFGEMVVIVRDELKPFFRFMMRQNGALFSKGWLVSMQFEALLKDGLYEQLGRHCNELGRKLADGIRAKGYELAYEPGSNMIFPIFPKDQAAFLGNKVMFETWEDRGDAHVIRLVTSWASTEEEINEFLALI